jgi:hypothetical protein
MKNIGNSARSFPETKIKKKKKKSNEQKDTHSSSWIVNKTNTFLHSLY